MTTKVTVKAQNQAESLPIIVEDMPHGFFWGKIRCGNDFLIADCGKLYDCELFHYSTGRKTLTLVRNCEVWRDVHGFVVENYRKVAEIGISVLLRE